MQYTHLKTDHINDAALRRAFDHASALLADCYSMLGIEQRPATGGGGCNFPLGLVLACVMDGMATEIYPIQVDPRVEPRKRQFARLRQLMKDRLAWGLPAHGWLAMGEAVGVLWTEIRNPLTHNLGADPGPKWRRHGFSDAAIIRQLYDGSLPTPDEMESTLTWNPKSPVMWAKPRSESGAPRIVVSAPALYWHVKKLAKDLAADSAILSRAIIVRAQRR